MRTGRSSAAAAVVAAVDSSLTGVDFVDFLDARFGVVVVVAGGGGGGGGVLVAVVVADDKFAALRRVDLEMVGEDSTAVGVPLRRLLTGGAV